MNLYQTKGANESKTIIRVVLFCPKVMQILRILSDGDIQ